MSYDAYHKTTRILDSIAQGCQNILNTLATTLPPIGASDDALSAWAEHYAATHDRLTGQYKQIARFLHDQNSKRADEAAAKAFAEASLKTGFAQHVRYDQIPDHDVCRKVALPVGWTQAEHGFYAGPDWVRALADLCRSMRLPKSSLRTARNAISTRADLSSQTVGISASTLAYFVEDQLMRAKRDGVPGTGILRVPGTQPVQYNICLPVPAIGVVTAEQEEGANQ